MSKLPYSGGKSSTVTKYGSTMVRSRMIGSEVSSLNELSTKTFHFVKQTGLNNGTH
jgi:hypothetical protein